ncbi:hypothetical protein WOLCODRAFT_166567 [Wolfiporia cocos MD-104 SS10]|uniref:Uncharacterized protein n=1 Tax=Wolfiporia cocos (strain MD-104) TaxID=742152 RepID=A0A2H3JIZ4_WOLCO|nr:hypothetical protein WOLCODRAFT_166567 [Wolfiporia cocos MD-104 SS10]
MSREGGASPVTPQKWAEFQSGAQNKSPISFTRSSWTPCRTTTTGRQTASTIRRASGALLACRPRGSTASFRPSDGKPSLFGHELCSKPPACVVQSAVVQTEAAIAGSAIWIASITQKRCPVHPLLGGLADCSTRAIGKINTDKKSEFARATAFRSLRPSLSTSRPQVPVVQAHQASHACGEGAEGNRRLPRLRSAQVSPAESCASASPYSSSPSTWGSPISRIPIPSGRTGGIKTLAPLPGLSSASPPARPDIPAVSPGPPPTSPPESPHAQRARSYRSTPPLPALALSTRFVIHRAHPTLAMSMHAPTPSMPYRSVSPLPVPGTSARRRSQSRSNCRSRPASPPPPLPTQAAQRPPPTRPPSRSERLLRDTLRRAEEHERMMNPLPSPKQSTLSLPSSPFLYPTGVLSLPLSSNEGRRHTRKDTVSSSSSSDVCENPYDASVISELDSTCDDLDLKGAPLRNLDTVSIHSASSATGSHAYTIPAKNGRTRSATQDAGTARTYADPGAVYGTPSSPAPVRNRLHRSATTASTTGRPSARSSARSKRASIDGERPACPPHDAVLRSKLEGVLRQAKAQERREKSSERRYRERENREPGTSSGSGSGNSMASSRNMSAEGDLFFAATGESSVTSLSSVDSKPVTMTVPTTTTRNRSSFSSTRHVPPSLTFSSRSPPATTTPLRSPTNKQLPLGSPSSSHAGLSPLTPPPTPPPFNARTAAEICRAMDGYVSFANIEGLGMPAGADIDEEDDSEAEDAKARGRWWNWLSLPNRGGRSASVVSQPGSLRRVDARLAAHPLVPECGPACGRPSPICSSSSCMRVGDAVTYSRATSCSLVDGMLTATPLALHPHLMSSLYLSSASTAPPPPHTHHLILPSLPPLDACEVVKSPAATCAPTPHRHFPSHPYTARMPALSCALRRLAGSHDISNTIIFPRSLQQFLDHVMIRKAFSLSRSAPKRLYAREFHESRRVRTASYRVSTLTPPSNSVDHCSNQERCHIEQELSHSPSQWRRPRGHRVCAARTDVSSTTHRAVLDRLTARLLYESSKVYQHICAFLSRTRRPHAFHLEARIRVQPMHTHANPSTGDARRRRVVMRRCTGPGCAGDVLPISHDRAERRGFAKRAASLRADEDWPVRAQAGSTSEEWTW